MPVPDLPDEVPVLIVALARRYGGIDARVIQLALGFRRLGRPCRVAATAGSPLHRELERLGLPVAASPHPPRDPRNIAWLARLARRDGTGVIDAQNPQSYLMGMAAAALAGVPGRVCTVHLDLRTFAGNGPKGWGLHALIRLCGRLGADFLTVSRDSARYLDGLGIPADRIAVTINALPPPDPGRADLRAEFGFAPDDLVAVVPARLEPQKGHRHLVEAMGRLGPGSPVRCLLLGDGPERDALTRQVAAAGLGRRVLFAGFRRDAVDLIAAADLMCLPSLLEGLPFAALEAAAVGTPMLATRVGGIPDCFEHGLTARLVAARDVEALARELDWGTRNPPAPAAQAAAARAMVAETFSPARMLAEAVAAYGRAHGRGRRTGAARTAPDPAAGQARTR